jgi:hypothetical protein
MFKRANIVSERHARLLATSQQLLAWKAADLLQ